MSGPRRASQRAGDALSRCRRRWRRYRSTLSAVLRPKGHARSRRPLPSTRATWSSSSRVVQAQAEQLAAAHAGVDEQPDDGLVAHVLEPAGRAGPKQRLELLLAQHPDRLLGHRGWSHAPHRRLADLALFDEEPEELLHGSVAVRDRRRAAAGCLQLDDPAFDVLSSDLPHGPGAAGAGQEGVELAHGLEVGLDRARRAVGGLQGTAEALGEQRELAYAGRAAAHGRRDPKVFGVLGEACGLRALGSTAVSLRPREHAGQGPKTTGSSAAR